MIKAIGFRALIKPDEVVKKTAGGIYLALDERMELNAQVVGTIVEIGPDFAVAFRPTLPAWGLKPGDKVFYAKYAGKWVKDPETEEEFLFVNDEDIVGKVETKNEAPVVETKEA